MRAQEGIALTKSSLGFQFTRKAFGSSDGSYIEQEYTESGGGIGAYAIGDGEVLTRSYPNSHGGQWVQGGWEVIEGFDLVGNAPRVAEEAVRLLSAEPCPSGDYDLIIDASQLALQVHESVGHPTELDRVLGDEAAFAGTSFLNLEDLDVAALRLGQRHRHCRRDRPRFARQLRLRRRGRAGAARLPRARRRLHRLPHLARVRARDRAHEQRLHARRRLEPHPAHPHDHGLARARRPGIQTT